ncbi:DUF397 domain-containing protein [Pseudonocardia kunmingensis]|uniref:Uncharacterized protein DUF397 n=1 Tax=Pseudonocardia kunmingensis TaxID=630975 RepID=A0A543DAY4_9PSEU|nr:DUF397 domain-containing protein [Pseudonocardia kunmingensis]TQM06486.1 uncharacterized protein DUF397 [Pseudonocardia kunmingensis]
MEESARGAGPRFRTSSFSGGENCVEVARLEDGSVAVRHSRAVVAGGGLVFTGDEWAAFVAGVKNGEFDPA